MVESTTFPGTPSVCCRALYLAHKQSARLPFLPPRKVCAVRLCWRDSRRASKSDLRIRHRVSLVLCLEAYRLQACLIFIGSAQAKTLCELKTDCFKLAEWPGGPQWVQKRRFDCRQASSVLPQSTDLAEDGRRYRLGNARC